MCGTIEVGWFFVSESLQGADNWTNMFDDTENCPGEMESAVAKAGPFESLADVTLSRGIHNLLDTFSEDWSDLICVQIDLGPYLAVSRKIITMFRESK